MTVWMCRILRQRVSPSSLANVAGPQMTMKELRGRSPRTRFIKYSWWGVRAKAGIPATPDRGGGRSTSSSVRRDWRVRRTHIVDCRARPNESLSFAWLRAVPANTQQAHAGISLLYSYDQQSRPWNSSPYHSEKYGKRIQARLAHQELSRARYCFRNSPFCSFPVGVRGNSSTKSTLFGALYEAIRDFAKSMISFSSSVVAA